MNLDFFGKVGKLFEAQKIVHRGVRYCASLVVLFFGFVYLLFFFTSFPNEPFEIWWHIMSFYTKVFVVVESFLAALVLNTQIYVAINYSFRILKKRIGAGLVGSFVAGVVATACCSPFVIGLLGLGGAVFFVSSNKTYFFILALAMLVASLYYSSKIIFCKECQVKLGVAGKEKKSLRQFRR